MSYEKTFLCNQCPQAFSQGGNLKIHLRTYSDEKPFPYTQSPKETECKDTKDSVSLDFLTRRGFEETLKTLR